jgi:xanthine/uracil permease
MEGLGCLLTGIWGGFSNTSLTGNIGAVGLTRVASRKIAVYGASISIFLGLFGKFSGAVATIPRPVLGGLFCVLFGLISSIGLRTVAKADLNSVRNSLIIGFIIYMGFSVPHYFSQTEIVIPSAPWLAQIVSALGSTGIAVTAFLGLILDNIIPGSRKERGFDSDDAEEDLVA